MVAIVLDTQGVNFAKERRWSYKAQDTIFAERECYPTCTGPANLQDITESISKLTISKYVTVTYI